MAGGQLEALEQLLDVWEEWGNTSQLGLRFRRAQLSRMEGDWLRSREWLLSCVQELEGPQESNHSALDLRHVGAGASLRMQ